jgi:hypothetical protein
MPPKSPKGGLARYWFYYCEISLPISPPLGYLGGMKKNGKENRIFTGPPHSNINKGKGN